MIESIYKKINNAEPRYRQLRKNVNDHPKKEKSERIMEYIETKL